MSGLKNPYKRMCHHFALESRPWKSARLDIFRDLSTNIDCNNVGHGKKRG
jgi:hypothetical protein